MMRVAENPEMRRSFREAGPAASSAYTVRGMSEAYLDAYQARVQ